MESERPILYVRILPDAVVGAGLVLRAGDVVTAKTLGRFLDSLLRAGAVEWVPVESGVASLR